MRCVACLRNTRRVFVRVGAGLSFIHGCVYRWIHVTKLSSLAAVLHVPRILLASAYNPNVFLSGLVRDVPKGKRQ